jgi:hypothetical protein
MIGRVVVAVAILMASILVVPANAKIACQAWCDKCNPTASCTADCVRRNQPSVPDSCGIRASTISCTAWCTKCKPDAECSAACSRTGNRQVTASCAVRGGG